MELQRMTRRLRYLPPHDRATEVPDFLDTDIRDRQTLFDTQREDWLLQTEPLWGDTSGRECPRAEQNRQRPSDVSELHGGPGSPCVGEMLTSPGGYWKCSSSGAGWGLPSGCYSEPLLAP